MNHDEQDSVRTGNMSAQAFEKELRLCRDALVEAKHRIIVLEQRLGIFLSVLILLVGIALSYGLIQIWQTSIFLKDLGHYVREERDPRWELSINEIIRNQQAIRSYVEEQEQLRKTRNSK